MPLRRSIIDLESQKDLLLMGQSRGVPAISALPEVTHARGVQDIQRFRPQPSGWALPSELRKTDAIPMADELVPTAEEVCVMVVSRDPNFDSYSSIAGRAARM